LAFKAGPSECILCPDMGGRIFGECCGLNLHRIDLDCAAHPAASFNNFGGNNFWPAPEGGQFGFNYRGNEWYVQQSINEQPFKVIEFNESSAVIEKKIKLVNRARTILETTMRREFSLLPEPPELLEKWQAHGFLAYSTTDSFKMSNRVSVDQALIAAWTLEQFDASDSTLSFCLVPASRSAINFDFYEHPGKRISYYEKGFTYRTDARRKGQIGVKAAAGALCIGFVDRSRNLICLRENRGPKTGTHFNIADNDQPLGPLSAADNYSIFNSDESMQAFELETIGPCRTKNNLLDGAELISRTSFAVLKNTAQLDEFLGQNLGRPI